MFKTIKLVLRAHAAKICAEGELARAQALSVETSARVDAIRADALASVRDPMHELFLKLNDYFSRTFGSESAPAPEQGCPTSCNAG